MPSLEELTGRQKAASDITSKHVRVRYNEATSVSGGLGKKIILRFPKLAGQFLDLSSITLHMSVSTSGDSVFDAYHYSSVFSRVRVLSSSQTIMDVDHFGEIATTIAQSETKVTETTASRRMQGLFASAGEATSEATASRRACISFPKGCFLNCSGLLPVSRLNGMLTVEFYLQDPNYVLYFPDGTAGLNYFLSDIQIHCNYLSSPSLEQYYSSNPVNLHVDSYHHRFQNLTGANSILRVPSAFNSLSRIIIALRDQSRVTAGIATQQKAQSFIPFTNLSSLQWFVANEPFYPEPIQGERLETELYRETVRALPAIAESVYQTDPRADKLQFGSVPIAVNFDSAPTKFREAISSGIKSKSHVSDLYAQVIYSGGVATANFAADCFLVANSRIYFDVSTGALNIEH